MFWTVFFAVLLALVVFRFLPVILAIFATLLVLGWVVSLFPHGEAYKASLEPSATAPLPPVDWETANEGKGEHVEDEARDRKQSDESVMPEGVSLGGNRDCTNVPQGQWTLDCGLPHGASPFGASSNRDKTSERQAGQPPAGTVSGLAPESKPTGACEGFDVVRKRVVEEVNRAFEKQALGRVNDVRLLGAAPSPDGGYCLIEAQTNVGIGVKLRYHWVGDRDILVDVPPKELRGTTPN